MKVYLAPEWHLSRSIHRIAQALIDSAPDSVEIVADREQSELEIIHVIGKGSLPADLGVRPFAMIQLCFRTTEDPRTDFWLPLWKRSRAVWSYFDLMGACPPWEFFNFYHAPLGVDSNCFRPMGGRKCYKVGTSGYIAETEGVAECNAAVKKLGARQFHLGPDLGFPRVDYLLDIPDEQVAQLWGQCEYVAGLRRVEGFELPAYEGLLCGSRPIVFDAPHYRRWLGDHADYVTEAPAAELGELLAEKFAQDPRPVSDAERAKAAETFNWPRIAGGFWGRVL